MIKKRRKYVKSRTSPKGGKRGCLCADGRTYSSKCCDGSLEGQGIGNITLGQTDSAGTIISQDTTSTTSSTSTSLPSQGNSIVISQDTTNTIVNSTSTAFITNMEITPGAYEIGDNLPLVVTFNEEVSVDVSGGTPSVDVNIDQNTVEFSYTSGDDTNELTFEYTLTQNNAAFETVEVASNININGGSITTSGNDPIDASTESITIVIEDVISPTPQSSGEATFFYLGVSDLCLGGGHYRFTDTEVCGDNASHSVRVIKLGEELPNVGDIIYVPLRSYPYYIEGSNLTYTGNPLWWFSVKTSSSTCAAPRPIEYMIRIDTNGEVLEVYSC